MKIQSLILSSLSCEELKLLIKEAVNESRQHNYAENPKLNDEELLSRQQACALLKITKPTLWSWTKEGVIVSYRINSRIYYKRSELIASLNQILSQKHKKR